MADCVRSRGGLLHEYSIVRALLERVAVEADSRGASAVTRVEVAVGGQAGVEVELLRSAFELARTGTCCQEAALELRTIPAAWACRACAAPVAADGPLRCASCGAPARLVAGDEILLERLELEVP